jgi:hypothetical protein
MAQRHKFEPGDRFRGKRDGVKAWVRDQIGTILGPGPSPGEYHVRFDSGEESWVMSNWIEKL